MESTFRVKNNHAFVVKESDIKKIWDKLESFDKSVTAIVEFTDSIERKVDSCETLIQFENSKKRQIKRIELMAICKEKINITRVELENDEYRTISIASSGDDETVTKIGDQIPEIIDGLKPWYSMIARLDLIWVCSLIIFLFGFFVSVMVPDSESKDPLSFDQALRALSILGGVLFTGFFAYKYVNCFKKTIFPIGCFALGQGKERYEMQEKIRWSVVVALIISLLSSTIYGLLT
ncbi:hypothetical protein B0W48_18965 [Pseudoalteromonas aliena]|uniref:Uncharacterized protein n=1 Tax=Pseudoalteromonas aliena TaxID=247523 RepID=A0A1Q2H2U6_9GAMM|nr:hypothetical protein [Pseudoalteromonas aliena]AQQ01683.1 hypothetical protein B0W48_18965 [Pseudoalteromonas aliena]